MNEFWLEVPTLGGKCFYYCREPSVEACAKSRESRESFLVSRKFQEKNKNTSEEVKNILDGLGIRLGKKIFQILKYRANLLAIFHGRLLFGVL